MADVTEGAYEASQVESAGGSVSRRAGVLVQAAGGLVSLALIVGIGVWGYKLWVRDVEGIPVVRAMEGPMREAPANPGGELALHTGLAVNAVAAVGEAAPPGDVLVLAPPVAEFSEDDLMDMSMAEAGEFLPEDGLDPDAAALPMQVAAAVDEATSAVVNLGQPAAVAPMSSDAMQALADQIAAGVAPLEDFADGEAAPVALALDGEAADVSVALVSGGIGRALRPVARPANAVAAAPAGVGTATAQAPVLSGDVAAGTVLVQLGAYESQEIAAQEWDRLSGRFAAFIAGKERLVQQAETGGQTFFRLRASGFPDMADARRFCTALIAENAACIPVVVR